MSFLKYIKLIIAYDGTNYCGWQIQKNGPSIHEALMKAGSGFLREYFTITGCSRTDSGVHALGYVALLALSEDIETRRIPRAFNSHLPEDIVVYNAIEVSEEFHPRYNAKNKHYRYTIYNNAYPLPQFIHYTYYYYKPLDVDKMIEAAKAFEGKHDFVAFSSIKTSVNDTKREIFSCKVTKEGDYIHMDIIGDGFLYNMVRIIMGTLIDVGLLRIEPNQIAHIIASKNRNLAKKTAPARGLTLIGLEYANDINRIEEKLE